MSFLMVLSLTKYSSPTSVKSFLFFPVNIRQSISSHQLQQYATLSARCGKTSFFISSLIKLCGMLLYLQGSKMYGHCFKQTIREKSIKDSPNTKWSKATGKLMHRQQHQQQKDVMIGNYRICKYSAGIGASKHTMPDCRNVQNIILQLQSKRALSSSAHGMAGSLISMNDSVKLVRDRNR